VIDRGKQNLLGVRIDAVDYEAAIDRVISAAVEGRGYSVSALAVHGVMTGVQDREHRARLNTLDLVTPDGQPVRWALNWLHRTRLRERVYGPTLTLELCRRAAEAGLPIYLYGSHTEVLDRLADRLTHRFPGLEIAGREPSRFRQTTPEEQLEIASTIKASGARLAFIGLGCPRQEVFAYEYRDLLGMPTIAVGAAFDYHAGLVDEPPGWMQDRGLQWLYRLLQEPRRLWRRYLLLNPAYLALVAAQRLRLWRPAEGTDVQPEPLRYG
jgi:N-acetylglucosaminyldiphosphoundecaprenol N-acetyl-beta-D-mannosaminyltransferase